MTIPYRIFFILISSLTIIATSNSEISHANNTTIASHLKQSNLEPILASQNISEWSELETLFKQHKKLYTLINVWASWCLPCKEELPILNQFDKNNNKWTVLYVNIDKQKDNALSFLHQNDLKIQHKTWFDPKLTLMRALKLRGVPSNLILDNNGNIISIITGVFTESSLKSFTSTIEQNDSS